MTAEHKPTAHIHTLGCKVNQVESAQIADFLRKAGYSVHTGPSGAGADLCIVNTCAVTHKAAAESRRAAARMARSGAVTVATGCAVQLSPHEYEAIEGIGCVAGNGHKTDLLDPEKLSCRSGGPRMLMSDILRRTGFQDLGNGYLSTKTRAFLKIQDGCSSFCSYCVVPHARGPARSLAPDLVLERCRSLSGQGFREIVLTGIHLGTYGADLDSPVSLARIVAGVSDASAGARIRLSSVEPVEVTGELVKLLGGSPVICPHVHLPLQSGDAGVLKRMNRHYAPEEYADVVQSLARAVPDVSLGADVMVGFPGEDEAAFSRTAALIERLPLSHLHVFPYSPREGTPAAKMPDQVDEREKRRRAGYLRDLGYRKKWGYFERLVGTEAEVLIQEGPDDRGRLRGLSERYVPVAVKTDAPHLNRMITVKLTGVEADPSGPLMTGTAVSL